jgi:cob(I)alamin adenosyltransferase
MGMVCVFTGNGKGKTSAAFGMAMRFLGHGKRVVVVQFLKGKKTGEIFVKKNLPGLEIIQFGTEDFVDLKNPSKQDKQRALEALMYVKRVMTGGYRPDLIVLDEANVAVSSGLVDEVDMLDIIESLPEEMTLVLTGRGATENIIERADLVTEMKEIKHPLAKGKGPEKGIEY